MYLYKTGSIDLNDLLDDSSRYGSWNIKHTCTCMFYHTNFEANALNDHKRTLTTIRLNVPHIFTTSVPNFGSFSTANRVQVAGHFKKSPTLNSPKWYWTLQVTHICCTSTPSPVLQSFSLHGQPFFHFETSASSDPKMTLYTARLIVPIYMCY